KGSNITGERARFDFNFDRALKDEEIAKVERKINEWIEADLGVVSSSMPKEEAFGAGALHFFDGKYPDEVTVYSVGKVSKEICMGPHVGRTGEIGKIKIVKETASSKGVRRVYLERVGSDE
ncbi:alanine--tRNA ligase, partial [Microgenomates group bacterium]|nr:alanine--tRNA ligase [Microgenomates group bacterium]